MAGETPGGKGATRRLLVITANVGEGHNAAARAVMAAVLRRWPETEIDQLDAFELMGQRIARWMRTSYEFTLEHTPGVYQFYFDALWHHPLFARITKRMVASVFGRRLARRPEVHTAEWVVCTHPFGAAAMDWGRRAGRWATPTAAFVTDFAPHPFWVWGRIDLHVVMHESVVPYARKFGATGQIHAAALPVGRDFRPSEPGDQRAARLALDLEQDSVVVLVTGGSWGVGALAKTVRDLLEVGEPVQVVAVCGYNEPLRAELEALGAPRERLVVFGWVDNMPSIMTATDVVVTNAGGVTALEALACERRLLFFEPIAGHGRANARLMQEAGVAVVCATAEDLRATVRSMADARLGADAAPRRTSVRAWRDLADELEDFVRVPPSARPASAIRVRPSPATDAHAPLLDGPTRRRRLSFRDRRHRQGHAPARPHRPDETASS